MESKPDRLNSFYKDIDAKNREASRMAKLFCFHCWQPIAGYGAIGDQHLCHPNDPEAMDCFRLVTVYHHGIPCTDCIRDNKEYFEEQQRKEAYEDGHLDVQRWGRDDRV